jgi:crossover junction endodeoxyribonuclease RusA
MTIRAYGIPVPQGSMRSFRHRTTGKVVTMADRPDLGTWRQTIAAAAVAQGAAIPLPMTATAIRLTATFYLPRPKSLSRRVRHPHKRPDLDKLLRALLDALTGIAWADDGQVVRFGDVEKVYATPQEPPGVAFEVKPIVCVEG